MLPGKKYKPEDLAGILRKHIWWVLVPFALVSAGTAAVARKLPDRYYSEAIVRVVPQQVPDQYVKSQQTENIQDRLKAMQAQVLSRTQLERVINELNLYPERAPAGNHGGRRPADEERHQLRRPARAMCFVSASPDPTRARCRRSPRRCPVSSSTESLNDQSSLAAGTSQFLEAQVEDARQPPGRAGEEAAGLPDQVLGPVADAARVEPPGAGQRARTDPRAFRRDQPGADPAPAARKPGEGPRRSDARRRGPGFVADDVRGGRHRCRAGRSCSSWSSPRRSSISSRSTTPTPSRMCRRLKSIVADLQAKVDAEALTRPVSAEATPAVSSVELRATEEAQGDAGSDCSAR